MACGRLSECEGKFSDKAGDGGAGMGRAHSAAAGPPAFSIQVDASSAAQRAASMPESGSGPPRTSSLPTAADKWQLPTVAGTSKT